MRKNISYLGLFHPYMLAPRFQITGFLLFMLCLSLQAQQDRFWYFGTNGVGIDWGNCEPAILEGGILGEEGTVAVSSSEGDLLFYSNSDFVWDSTDNLMQNGEISNAFFDPLFSIPEVSTLTQIAAAKKPGAGNVYYLFSSDIQNINAYNLRYITIDMDLNGGLGAVADITALSDNPMTEKLCTVPKSVGEGFWFIAHEYLNNRFLVFDVDEGGVNPTPQVFELGLPHLASQNSLNTRGELKANLEGSKLAMVQDQLSGALEIFDFDPATGTVSNPLVIDEVDHGYGVSFSPDASLLYVSTWSSTASVPNFLYQYNLNAGDALQIAASRITLQTASTPNPLGSIKLAPDGNLYIAKPGNTLDRINEPDNQGFACDYESDALNLGLGISGFGLNNIWEIEPTSSVPGIPELPLTVESCDPVTIGVEALPDATYLWSTGAVTSTINVSESGIFSLEITEQECVRSAEINVIIAPFDLDLGPDINVCEGTSTLLQANAQGDTFQWNTGAASPTLNVSESGIYTLTVTQGNCTSVDDIQVTFLPAPFIDLGPAQSLCPDETVTFSPGDPTLNYLWSDGSTAPSYTSGTSETVSVTADNGNCSVTASVEVSVVVFAGASFEDVQDTVCAGDTYSFLRPRGAEFWTIDGDTISNPSVLLPPGLYLSTISNRCEARSNLIDIFGDDCSCPVYVPNAFSPNGDGINELFLPSIGCQRAYNLRIFDRWGRLIFDTERTGMPGWNGSAMNDGYFVDNGLYVWTLFLDDFEGRLFAEELRGSVMLIR